MINIAIHGAGSLIGQGLIKALRRSDQYRIIGFDAFPTAVGNYWSDQVHTLPDILDPNVKEPDYVDQFIHLLTLSKADALLPATDFEIPMFARYRREIEAATTCKVIVSSPNVARIANDKWETYRWLKLNNFPYPPSTTVIDDVASVGYPLVVKPRCGARSRGVKVVKNGADLLPVGENLIYQKEIGSPDHEYTAGAVVLDNECVGVIVMRRILKDGNTIRAYLERHVEREDFIRKAALQLQPYGPVNFQFRLNEQGQPVIFEINARFSGTTIMRVMAGFNEVEACIRHALYGEKPRLEQDRCGMIIRYWEEQWAGPCLAASSPDF